MCLLGALVLPAAASAQAPPPPPSPPNQALLPPQPPPGAHAGSPQGPPGGFQPGRGNLPDGERNGGGASTRRHGDRAAGINLGSVAALSSRERSDWVNRDEKLVTAATRTGNAETLSLVRDVIAILESLDGAPLGGSGAPRPFDDKPVVVLPALLAFEPTRSSRIAAQRRIEQALAGSRVAFGVLSF